MRMVASKLLGKVNLEACKHMHVCTHTHNDMLRLGYVTLWQHDVQGSNCIRQCLHGNRTWQHVHGNMEHAGMLPCPSLYANIKRWHSTQPLFHTVFFFVGLSPLLNEQLLLSFSTAKFLSLLLLFQQKYIAIIYTLCSHNFSFGRTCFCTRQQWSNHSHMHTKVMLEIV